MYHITYRENLDSIQKNGIIPMIGNNSEAIEEDIPRIYLFSDHVAMMDATWFWDFFEEDDDLVVLEVSIHELNLIPTFAGEYSWEYSTTEMIPAQRVRVRDDIIV